MKKSVLILFGFLFCCCAPKSNRYIYITISQVLPNYFENDSLQRLSGYELPSIYMIVDFENTSEDTLFFPLKKRHEDDIKSHFYLRYEDDKWIEGETASAFEPYITPLQKDKMILVFDLWDVGDEEIFSILYGLRKHLELQYIYEEQDSVLSKFLLPDSIIFVIPDSLKVEFMPKEEVGHHIEWI